MYYVSVIAENEAGLRSSIASSDGVLMDATGKHFHKYYENICIKVFVIIHMSTELDKESFKILQKNIVVQPH
jgi:hypothetical protein